MQPLLILPLIAFLILLALFALVLRRAGRFLAETRDVERFRRQVGDLGSRVETSLGEVSAQVDALRPPATATAIRREIVGELERASRALEMIEHGRLIQTSARSGGRELEAQTSIKRGYLNVLHAREAIARQRQAAADLVVGQGPDRFQRRRA
jgi:hypothetical protein